MLLGSSALQEGGSQGVDNAGFGIDRRFAGVSSLCSFQVGSSSLASGHDVYLCLPNPTPQRSKEESFAGFTQREEVHRVLDSHHHIAITSELSNHLLPLHAFHSPPHIMRLIVIHNELKTFHES